jgi:hypothetical protein
MSWADLNERQQQYLLEIYKQDQEQERNERSSFAHGYRSRPANEWRWIHYGDTQIGPSPLKYALQQLKLVDPGTGSTFEALEKRGYVLMKYEQAKDPVFGGWFTIVYTQITPKGRKLVRGATGEQREKPLPTGTLREWHWRALCRAYVRGEQGMDYDIDTGDGFGYVSWNTCLRLRDYRVQGQDRPLIREGHWSEPRTQAALVITPYGEQYYYENWQRYRDLYPDVDAPKP